MPPINKYKCNYCGFSFPDGWGGYFYVEVDKELLEKRIREVEEDLKLCGEVNKHMNDIRMTMERLPKELALRIRVKLQELRSIIPETSRLSHYIHELDRSVKMLEELRYYEVVPRDLRAFEFLKRIERDIADEKGRLESLLKELIEIKERLESSGLRSMRLPCPHPFESDYAKKILGDVDRDAFKSRTGFNSYAICLDCQHQFEGDFRDEKVNEWRFYYGCPSFEKAFRGKPEMKDERKCPRCGSSNVKTVFELINQTCPKCKKGIIEEIETGMIA